MGAAPDGRCTWDSRRLAWGSLTCHHALPCAGIGLFARFYRLISGASTVRHVFFPLAVFAIVAAAPWLLWATDLGSTFRDMAPVQHKGGRDEPRAALQALDGKPRKWGQSTVAAPGVSAGGQATLEIVRGRIRNGAHPQRSNGNDHPTLKIVGGKLGDSGNQPVTTPTAAISLEPHAILEIRDGKVVRIRRAGPLYSRGLSGG